MLNFFCSKKIATILIVFFLAAGLYSCRCIKCTVTPPPLSTYATDLEAHNHSMDSATADEWIQRFNLNRDSICNNMANGQDSIFYCSEAFNKKYLLKLLCLKDCIGIRIYYGMDPLFKVHQIIFGVDQKGDDLYYTYKAGDPLPFGYTTPPAVGAKLVDEDGMGCPKKPCN
jgi:hypothetical protein